MKDTSVGCLVGIIDTDDAREAQGSRVWCEDVEQKISQDTMQASTLPAEVHLQTTRSALAYEILQPAKLSVWM